MHGVRFIIRAQPAVALASARAQSLGTHVRVRSAVTFVPLTTGIFPVYLHHRRTQPWRYTEESAKASELNNLGSQEV